MFSSFTLVKPVTVDRVFTNVSRVWLVLSWAQQKLTPKPIVVKHNVSWVGWIGQRYPVPVYDDDDHGNHVDA